MSSTPLPPNTQEPINFSANSLPPEFSRTFHSSSSNRHPPSFRFLQLNCQNRKDSTLSVLACKSWSLEILLQEPWINPVDHLPPTHPDWHRVTPVDRPKNSSERPRCCIYINRSTMTQNFHRLLGNSKLLTAAAVTICTNNSTPLNYVPISL